MRDIREPVANSREEIRIMAFIRPLRPARSRFSRALALFLLAVMCGGLAGAPARAAVTVESVSTLLRLPVGLTITATVKINRGGAAGPVTIHVIADSTYLDAPETFEIPAGKSSGEFQITARYPSLPASVDLCVWTGASSACTSVVTTNPAVRSFDHNGPLVYGVENSVTLQLTAPALHDVFVDISATDSENPSSPILGPDVVTVPAGASSARFWLTPTGEPRMSTAVLCGTVDEYQVCVLAGLVPPPALSSFTVTPHGVAARGTMTAALRLTEPMPQDGDLRVIVSYQQAGSDPVLPLYGFPDDPLTFSGGDIEKSLSYTVPSHPEWQHYKITAQTLAGVPRLSAEDDVFVAPRPLRFTAQPSGAAAGKALATQPVVICPNDDGDPHEGFNGYVNVSLDPDTGTPGATLSGTTRVKASHGTATFADLSIDRPGTGYVLVAQYESFNTSGASAQPDMPVTSVRSAPFDMSGIDIAMFSFSPVQKYLTVPFTGTIKLTSPVPAGAPLKIPLTVRRYAAGQGASLVVPSFVMVPPGKDTASFLVVAYGNSVGEGTICANTGSFEWCEPFMADLLPMPFQLIVSPHAVVGGGDVTATITLAAPVPVGASLKVDTYCMNRPGGDENIPAPSFPQSITFRAGEQTKSFTFQTFPEQDAWKRYVVQAYAAGTGMIDRLTDDVWAGPPPLQWGTQPSGAYAGGPLQQQPVVKVPLRDGQVNTNFNGDITISLDPTTGTSGASLGGTTTVKAVNGVATFTDLSIDKIGTGYVLVADYAGIEPPYTEPYLTRIRSDAFDVSSDVGPAVESVSVPTVVYYSLPFVVDISLTKPTTTPLTVLLTWDLGEPGASASMPRSVVVPAGERTVRLDTQTVGWFLGSTGTVCATAGGPDVCATFAMTEFAGFFRVSVTPPALQPPAAPGAITVGLDRAIPDGGGIPVSLAILDSTGRPAPDVSVTPAVFMISSGQPTVDAFLTASPVVDWKHYLVEAQSSEPYNIPVSQKDIYIAPHALAYSTQPAGATAGAVFPAPPVVILPGEGGAPDSAFNGYVTVSLDPASGAPGAVLSGTKRVKAVSGKATLADLSVDKAGTGYVLVADFESFVTSGASTQAGMPVTAVRSTPFRVAPPPVYGDADGDGRVTVPDAVKTLRLSAGLGTAVDIHLLDVAPRTGPGVYGDGRVDLLDVLRILRRASGLEQEWPG